VGTVQRQRDAAEAIAAAWWTRPWPGAGLRSFGILTGDDGDTLLLVSLLDDLDTVPEQDPNWKQDVDAAVPGIERDGVVAARLYRSSPAHRDVNEAGCLVLVTRIFEDPDVSEAERFVDALFEAGAGVPPADGLISADVYVSVDGARVLNYALWTGADAHRRATEDVPQPLAEDPRWQQAHEWPGLRSTSFRRFEPLLQLTRPDP
jgi:hypothetical protein